MSARIMASVLALAVLVACEGTIFAPDPLELTGVKSATADQVEYAIGQYEHVERCLDLAGDVDRVVWRTAVRIMVDDRKPMGVGQRNTIYVRADLAGVIRLPSGRLIGTAWVWRHESMHHILGIATVDVPQGTCERPVLTRVPAARASGAARKRGCNRLWAASLRGVHRSGVEDWETLRH